VTLDKFMKPWEAASLGSPARDCCTTETRRGPSRLIQPGFLGQTFLGHVIPQLLRRGTLLPASLPGTGRL